MRCSTPELLRHWSLRTPAIVIGNNGVSSGGRSENGFDAGRIEGILPVAVDLECGADDGRIEMGKQLCSIFAGERFAIGRIPFPIGVSLLAVGESSPE